uniref:Uncharacterized protein n=1 Tax=virus sp. ctBM815 TaxID=2825806 RepID=A0A8S5RJZ2_9VIRU|nr:MAG TPA: hypothetical protein [virus sp. ctBM815]
MFRKCPWINPLHQIKIKISVKIYYFFMIIFCKLYILYISFCDFFFINICF